MADELNRYPKLKKRGFTLIECPDSKIMVVPFEQPSARFSANELQRFRDAMRGATCVMGGWYPWDVEMFLEGGRNFD